MKQKYTILRDEKTDGLTIQEHAELSKDMFSLVCEQSYDSSTITSAIEQNKQILIDTLRTPNLYPISDYIDKIADAVVDLYKGDRSSTSAELLFDDVNIFKEEEPEVTAEEESVEIDDLLADDEDAEEVEDVEESEKPENEKPVDEPPEDEKKS